MKATLLAIRYAKAVLANLSPDGYDSFLNDIHRLQEILAIHTDIISSLDSFLYPPRKRIALAKELTTDLKHSSIWKNLFIILVNKHKFSIITVILYSLEELVLDKNNTVKVNLTLAFEQSDNIVNEIKQYVKSILKKNVIFKVTVNPVIIGGFVAETDHIRIDGSIKNNLVKFAQLS